VLPDANDFLAAAMNAIQAGHISQFQQPCVDRHGGSDDQQPEAPPAAESAPESEASPDSQPDSPPASAQKLQFFPWTDSGNAERIVARFGRDIHYCHPEKCWYKWDARRWAEDRQGTMMALAKKIARSLYAEAAEIEDDLERKKCRDFARACESTDRKKAAIVSAQSEPGIPVLPDDFDGDGWLFNCLNGTIDLRTGKLRPHDRRDLISKLAPVKYAPEAISELWNRFLDDVTGGDEKMKSFLKRAAGYSMAGDASEERLFLMIGKGGSGKSTFLESIKGTMGDYAKTADAETFLQRKAGGVRDDIAELAGRRLVTAIEVDRGQKLAEAMIKFLTGGDTVRARFLYKAGFDYRPQFTPWIAANDPPMVSHDDTGIWRRILRIPFNNVIPKEKRLPSVKARLRDTEECQQAILAWMVEGCLEWQEEGIGVPGVVEEATEEYRQEMDPLRDFVAEMCVVAKNACETLKKLRAAYERYCREIGEKHPITPKEFASCLRSRGCEPDHRRAGNVWVGIGLRADIPAPENREGCEPK